MKEPSKVSEPISYERIVLKNTSEYHYLKIQLVFQEQGVKLSAAQFKLLVISALKELHGEVGASFPLDLLKFDEKTLCAIVRICSSGLVKLWTSLTLLGHYQNHECSIRVIQASPFLLALAGNSRELALD
ncbi:ribonuclease P protein subunit p14 [Pseudophryne corroboree]|uniref:ribonuclease P protein subunit p14 n=1 Tax=Pseudophryne corroboree TaxID=495146 RepID=UPI003081EC6A